MAYKWPLLVLGGVLVFGLMAFLGYYAQSAILGQRKSTSQSTRLADEVVVQHTADLVKQELPSLPNLKVRLTGSVGDKMAYPYAMSLHAAPGEEDPVWTAACRVEQNGTSTPELVFYLNDSDYNQSTVPDKKAQLETFMLGCLVAQDEEFVKLPIDQQRVEVERLYEFVKTQGIELVE